MITFAWHSTSAVETAAAFNKRLFDFCLAEAVVNVEASVAGPVLLLALTLADEVDADSMACLTPSIVPLSAVDLRTSAEALVNEEIDRLKALDSDDEPCVPFRATLYALEEGAAVAVVIATGAVIEAEGGA